MTPGSPGVFLIVPAYNEGRALAATLAGIVGRRMSVVVVDDGSRDDTASVAAEFPVHVLRHAINLGQGAALQTGMTYALQAGAKYIVHFDADGQHDADEIEALLQPLVNGEADVVLGSRFLRPEDGRRVPAGRRIVLRTAVYVNWLLTGVKLSDAHNGFRALTRHAAERIKLEEDGFAHASEIITQIKKARLRFVEHPTGIRYTDYSRAKGQSFWNGFNVVFDLVAGRVFK
jgi:glycosyltransferase involved in cell wall biosynthesis